MKINSYPRNISEVVSNNMCTGCGLCVESGAGMKIDKMGFLRPINPIEDEVSQACPSIKISRHQDILVKNSHSIWGGVYSSFTAASASEEVRFRGSSGGVISTLLKCLLDTNQVDRVIATSVSDSSKIENKTTNITEGSNVIDSAGSRYSPSSPLDFVRGDLNGSDRLAIVCKPCDASALRELKTKFPKFGDRIVVIISFFCAGIPSKLGSKEILEKYGVHEGELELFRYRGNGWPGDLTFETKEGSQYQMSYRESWGKVLNKYIQPRCKICADGIGDNADIVCADAWDTSEDGYPIIDSVDIESKGLSLVIVRTSEGKAVIDKAEINNVLINKKNFELNSLKKIQPYQYDRKKNALCRILALKILGQKVTNFSGFFLFKNMIKSGVYQCIRSFSGTLVRKLKGRF